MNLVSLARLTSLARSVSPATSMSAGLLSAFLLIAGLLSAFLLIAGRLPVHGAEPPLQTAGTAHEPETGPPRHVAGTANEPESGPPRRPAGQQDLKLQGAIPKGPPSGVRYGLVIAGLGGEKKYVDRHLAWARGFYDVLKFEHGFQTDRLYLLVEDPTAAGGAPAVKSTLEEIQGALDDLARRVRPGDDLFVLLIGHGSVSRAGPRLNIPGPDLTAEALRAALDEIGGRYTVVVNGASSSAPFIDALSGSGRVIVTATKSGAERLSTIFPEHLLAALKEQAGDLDKDGRVSVLESFVYARNRTAEWYDGQGLLATEHALLDDNGDGRGTREPGPGGTDGTLAGRIYFGPGPEASAEAGPPGTPEGQALQARMEELRWRIDELKARKDQVDPGEYATRMEEMLIELARVTRAIRQLGAPEGQPPRP